jgi:hypothetical protein
MDEPLKILSLRLLEDGKVRIYASSLTKEEKIYLLEEALKYLNN